MHNMYVDVCKRRRVGVHFCRDFCGGKKVVVVVVASLKDQKRPYDE